MTTGAVERKVLPFPPSDILSSEFEILSYLKFCHDVYVGLTVDNH